MFLSIQTREKIQEIIRRISVNEDITLQERIFVENHAKHSSSIWTWLKRASSLRRHGKQNQESINGLIQSLTLDGLEKENHFNPKNDDIAEWFSGAPDWVRRS
tara:strand:+ start:638 stop:946 length:309 start_codon:yes stop_codon:yes gene_type:complete